METFRCLSFNHERELPAQMKGALHARIHALRSNRRMNTGRVASQKVDPG